MKEKIISILTLLIVSLSMSAQTANSILDKTANMFKASGGIQATFSAATYKGNTPQGSVQGTIYVKGQQFKIVSPNGNIWFDGKTQWSLYANSDEVNVTNPTPEELQSINPYTFINLYKNGYKASFVSKTYKNKACYEIKLVAQNSRKALKEMYIIVDKKTYYPYSVRLKQMNDWFHVNISNIKVHNKWNDSFFKFNAKNYPNIEVIDLR